jgi:hypothetical protein
VTLVANEQNIKLSIDLAFLSYWYRKKHLKMHFLTGYSVITQFAKLAAGEQLCRQLHSQKIIALQNL